jgi:hypothetical protein
MTCFFALLCLTVLTNKRMTRNLLNLKGPFQQERINKQTLIQLQLILVNKRVPCHRSTAHLRAADGGDSLQVCGVKVR